MYINDTKATILDLESTAKEVGLWVNKTKAKKKMTRRRNKMLDRQYITIRDNNLEHIH